MCSSDLHTEDGVLNWTRSILSKAPRITIKETTPVEGSGIHVETLSDTTESDKDEDL